MSSTLLGNAGDEREASLSAIFPCSVEKRGTTRWQCWLRSPDRQAPFELECPIIPLPTYFPTPGKGRGYIYFKENQTKPQNKDVPKGENSRKVPRSWQCSQSQADSISGRGGPGSPVHPEALQRPLVPESVLCLLLILDRDNFLKITGL